VTPAEDYDVVVVGGGASGVAAAVGAARLGARTLLVEAGPCLGGAATLRNVLTYCGLWTNGDPPRLAVAGVAQDVINELRRLAAVDAPHRTASGRVVALIDCEGTKIALDRVCAAARVDVVLHTLAVGAERDGSRIASVLLHDHRGVREATATAFVDASGEGDLAEFAGASVRYGNDGKVQTGTLSVRFGGVAHDADTSPRRWAEAIREAKAAGVEPLSKESGLVFRAPVSGDVVAYLIDEAYDARDGSSLTHAEVRGREQSRALLRAIQTIPGHECAYIVATGPQFGTRESRHVNARYRLTEQDVVDGRRFEDVVALGAWPVEYHATPGRPFTWKPIRDDGTFDIPLRSLWSLDTDNLFAAGRLIDGDRYGGSAVRVMGTAFATGHAAGIAAALLAAAGSVRTTSVQAELHTQMAVLKA
jgi:hypothetical protein